jgi:tetratricopeptide (TPR) repeat protein
MEQDARGGKRGPRAPRLVGRVEPLRALDAALSRATRFEAPQFVTLLGPLGIGKTRLLADWLDAVEQKGEARVVRVAVSAQSDAEAEPLAVVADLLRRRFGIDERIDPDAAHAAFRAELQVVFGDRRVAEVAGLLGRFLGFELPESPLGQALALRPEQETDVARAVLCRFLEADAAKRPLVIGIDDVHLADERSLELLGRLSAELGGAAIAVVTAARPELLVRRPEWGRGEGSHARVELGPLSELEMDVFIRTALATETLASGLAERAAVESGGNPFLLEQLLRVYLQHGILVAETGSAFRFDVERARQETLDLSPEEAAQARLAELTPAERDVLARGLAFGPVFWTGGVVALGRLGTEPWDATTVFAPDPAIAEVQRMLDLLAERDYLVALPASSVAGETEWSFAQAAERAILSAGVDPEVMGRRKRFAAQWVEGRAALTSDRLELIGNLLEEGGDPRRAGASFIAGGDDARKRLRYDRARGLYLRGLRLLDQDDSRLKLESYHSLGDVAARLGRTHEALAHFGEMLRVAWRMDLPAKGGAAHARIGRLYRSLGEYDKALQHLSLAHELFDLAGDRAGIAATLDDIGRVQFLTGNSDESRTCHQSALKVREALHDERGKALTLSWMGLVDAQAGELARAQHCFRRALRISQAMRDSHGIIFSLLDLAAIEREAGRPDRAQAVLEEARRLVHDLGERLYECHLALQIGDCLLAQGQAEVAQVELEMAREIARKFGARRLLAAAERGLAEARLAQGDTLGARDHAFTALNIAEAIGASPLAGAALRVLATAVARGAPGEPDRGGPREMFDRAVELLGSAGAELELGRTLSAYAEFEEGTGREDAAWELRRQAGDIQARACVGMALPSATPAPARLDGAA